MRKMTNGYDDTELRDAIGRMRHAINVPPIDPAREAALLAAFDRRRATPHRKPSQSVWAAAAAMAVLAVGLNWFVVRNGTRRDAAASAPSSIDLASFQPWPDAESFPPFESGSLVRVDLPLSALPGLGVSRPLSGSMVVQADILIGQDGFARAFRLVQ